MRISKVHTWMVACCLVMLLQNMYGQQPPTQAIVAHITGVVVDANTDRIITNLMFINLRTRQGTFAGATGTFDINVFKSDTIVISAPGYNNLRLCMADSVDREIYRLRLELHRITVTLKEITVFAPRDLQDIQKDIEKLGYNKKDYMYSGISVVESPITFLYQQFSRRERAKRDIAEKRNNDMRRELLRELLAKYVANDIIQLPDNQFDQFIDFCNVNDEFLKSCSQYEFIMFVKKKHEFFKY